MKLKNINRLACYAQLLLGLTLLGACQNDVDEFLDELPSKNSGIPISTTAQLEALLDAHYEMGNEKDGIMRLYASDDYEYSDISYNNEPSFFNSLRMMYLCTWDRTYMADLSNDDWTFQWGRIFTANLILGSLPKVSGTETDKIRLKSEAHFVRANAYWVLANTYCLPYNTANKDAKGLPIKVSTSFEGDMSRVPLHQVYELIEADLHEALKITTPIISNGIVRSWRANIAGVNAFAARYYLHTGDYAKAESYATVSLNAYSTMMDYNNLTDIDFDPIFPMFSTAFSVPDAVTYKEFTSYRSVEDGATVPSASLLNMYDVENDMRYVYNVAEGAGELFGFPKIDQLYTGISFSSFATGTTVSETIITKAEALARLNRVPEAMALVNQLRIKRLKPTAPNLLLTASSQRDAITKILQERRRELPFGLRWYDMRRLNHNEDPNDNETYVRKFYQYNQVGVVLNSEPIIYTLEPGSKKYAFMIPKSDIIASNNVIIQNDY